MRERMAPWGAGVWQAGRASGELERVPSSRLGPRKGEGVETLGLIWVHGAVWLGFLLSEFWDILRSEGVSAGPGEVPENAASVRPAPVTRARRGAQTAPNDRDQHREARGRP